MAVTDLTDSLPWWTRNGAGPTGGPAATPQGGGVGGQPPPGMNQQAWLQYLMQMFNPMGSANAAEADPMAALRAGGSPVPSALGGGGPAVPPSVVQPPAPPGAMPARPAGVSASGLPLQPGSLAPGALAQFNNGGAGGYVPSPSGGGSMSPTAPPPPGQQAVGGVPGPLASGGAGGVGATSNPRFTQVDRPNMSAAGGFGRGGAPQMTALNLAGLFGGQGAGPAAAAGPTYNNVGIRQTGVPGPLASNAPMPPTMPDDIRRQRAIQLAAARSGFA